MTEEYIRCVRHFDKKRPRESEAMASNLRRYVAALESGLHPSQVHPKRRETNGAIAIDQKGAPGKPTQTRLYVYPDADARTLYLITIGDKKSQPKDNVTCRRLIQDLRAAASAAPPPPAIEGSDEGKPDDPDIPG